MEMDRPMAEGIPFTREQMQAAYALNLCTVSVSQIIDYNDMTVLDQEYETILNNLNLENMPKDEALLEILKRLMETITFFRMQEGEKEFIEKEYQQKMKNAIWTAVPNLALLVAGANPVSLAASLAAQVGIGYMNYRKNRAQYHLDRDRQIWKLQRAAMEQFEGLQQQLFEAAWRLADKYGFPDAFRLTQKQIKQYNQILMDEDLIRKYERLDSIKERFAAYPPFWYYFGNTANLIACDEDLVMEPEVRSSFRDKAKKYFAYYQEVNRFNILREDQICAACCLEYADLLNPELEGDRIVALIDQAAKYAGGALDVHQLCAISYMKAGEKDKAALELRTLVNEDYNAVINAQLLSSIYVERFISTADPTEKSPYRLLESRVDRDYLFPMPKTTQVRPEEMQDYFLERQRRILKEMYELVLDRFFQKYGILMNRIIPLPGEAGVEDYPDEMFEDSPKAKQERINRVKIAFLGKNTMLSYQAQVCDIPYSYQMIDLLNRMFASLRGLDCIQDEQTRAKLQDSIKISLHEYRDTIQSIEKSLSDFNLEAYEASQELSLSLLVKEMRAELEKAVRNSVVTRNEMQDFAIAQTSLVRFCDAEGIESPESLYSSKNDAEEGDKDEVFFTPDLLGEQTVIQNDRILKNEKMIRIIKNHLEQVVVNKDVIEFYTQEDSRMNRYFYNKSMQKYAAVRSKTLAILDDQSRQDYDLLFATDGVMPILRGHVKNVVPYGEITWTGNSKKKELRMGIKYENENLNMDDLFDLIQELAYEIRVNGADDPDKEN